MEQELIRKILFITILGAYTFTILLYEKDSWLFLLFISVILICYFVLPLTNSIVKLLLLLNIIVFIFMISALNENFSLFPVLLLSFIVIESVSLLTNRQFFLFLLCCFTVCAGIFFVKSYLDVEMMLWTIFFLYISNKWKEAKDISEEKKELYEQLLMEYRQLKRVSLENEQAIRIKERSRIARDMHDSVGHKLTALLMKIEMISLLEKKNDKDLLMIKELANDSLEETRRAVRALKDEEIVGMSNIIHLIRKLESESTMNIHFTTKDGILTAPLSNQQSVVIYRVIQEALTNAMKHGGSRDVIVLIGRNSLEHLEFKISNKRRNKKIHFGSGFGLNSIKERVESITGKIRIYETEQDFIVEGSFPLKSHL